MFKDLATYGRLTEKQDTGLAPRRAAAARQAFAARRHDRQGLEARARLRAPLISFLKTAKRLARLTPSAATAATASGSQSAR